MSFGRVNGIYSWRCGWRADVLRLRDGGEDAIAPPVQRPERVDLDGDVGAEHDEKLAEHAQRAWRWWEEIGSPQFVVAPMVGQSDPAFRLLCRRHGAGLAYTPMFLASKVIAGDHDHELGIPGMQPALEWAGVQDRPLICQLAGGDVEEMVAAGLRVQA